ncbi:Zn-dependent exopeptidase [Neoconidiobolus thromboides FSU 785]|nr:Zn-dependent exopeptidase [Neoconidiobolus thromboides FSU 785]
MKLIQFVLATLLTTALAQIDTTNEGKRLIKSSENEPAIQMTEDEVLTQLIQKKKHFMDITELRGSRSSLFIPKGKPLPTKFKYQSYVKSTYKNIDIYRMRDFLTIYTTKFHNRYYKVQSGADASNWLRNQIQGIISYSNYKAPITVENFSHSFIQKSIIVKIPGSHHILKNEIVIVGSHLDSINLTNPATGRAPGADDDATGVVGNLETLRVLLGCNFRPKRTVEFHFYAGEEGGLLGSLDIAQTYSNQQKNVHAMTQFDMIGYLTKKKQIAFYIDYTNKELNDMLKKIVVEYLNFTTIDLVCGYGCSDHAAWDKFGYRAAFPFEIDESPYAHTVNDTLATVDFNYVKSFVKLAIAFLVEVAEK